MNLTQLKVFEALAQYLSFSKAAEKIGLSQSSVTVQLKSLQDEYGVALFRRHGQSMHLSSYGQELLPKIKRFIGTLKEMELLLKNSEQSDIGCLSVGLSVPHSAIEILSTFTRLNQHVRITAKVANSKGLLEQLSHCKIDIAIVNVVGSPPNSLSVFIKNQELIALIPADHRWGKRENIHISELDRQLVILREEGAASRKHFEKMVLAAGINPRIALVLNSGEGMKHAVTAQLGIGIAHEMQIDQQDWLVALPIIGGNVSAAQYLAFLPEYKNSRLVRSFIETSLSIKNNQ